MNAGSSDDKGRVGEGLLPQRMGHSSFKETSEQTFSTKNDQTSALWLLLHCRIHSRQTHLSMNNHNTTNNKNKENKGGIFPRRTVYFFDMQIFFPVGAVSKCQDESPGNIRTSPLKKH